MKNFRILLINKSKSILDALKQLDEISPIALTLFVVDDNDKVLGSITDGDIRRTLVKGSSIEDTVASICNKNFYFAQEKDKNLYLEISRLKEKGIKFIPILSEEGQVVKIIDIRNRKSILPIDVVLMAGGRGERLKPLTDAVPKPLLKIGDKPIIEHNIDRLIEYGVKNFFITENYLAEQLVCYFGDGSAKDVKIHHILEPKKLGTFGAISLIEKFENDYVLVMNSDIFTKMDFFDFFNHFILHDSDMSVAVIPYTLNIPFGVMDLEGGEIRSLTEKPSYTYYTNSGIYLLKKNKLKYVPKDSFFNATDMIEKLIESKDKVIRFPLSDLWIDIGSPDDYKKAQELVKHL